MLDATGREVVPPCLLFDTLMQGNVHTFLMKCNMQLRSVWNFSSTVYRCRHDQNGLLNEITSASIMTGWPSILKADGDSLNQQNLIGLPLHDTEVSSRSV